MLFKFVIFILSTTIVLADTSSSRHPTATEIIDAFDDGNQHKTRHVRKLRKDGSKQSDDTDGTEEDNQEEENVSQLSQFLAGSLRIATLDPDSTDWSRGTFAKSFARSGNIGTIKVYVPLEAQVGDHLFLFLSRTDGLLPLRIKGWSRGAECFKSYNRQDNCMRAAHCVDRDGPYCLKFRRDGEIGDGQDLAQVLFYRRLRSEDPGCFTIDIPGGTTVWTVATAVTNVNVDKPIRRVAGTSCDVEWDSKFPSVYGNKNDVLLLSQCFDDTAEKNHFRPPEGTELLGWTNSYDEAGFLFGKKLNESGNTGKLITGGPGGPKCKDAMLSVIVNRN